MSKPEYANVTVDEFLELKSDLRRVTSERDKYKAKLAAVAKGIVAANERSVKKVISAKTAASRGGQAAQAKKWQALCATCSHPKLDHKRETHVKNRQTGACHVCACREFVK